MEADWIQIILNGTLVLINILLVVIYTKMLRANKNMVYETKLSRAETYRPEVVAYIREENERLYLRIKNVGARPAFDIHLEIYSLFYNSELENQHKFVKQIQDTTRDVYKDIHLLAPSQGIETFLGHNHVLQKYNFDVISSPLKLTYFNSEKDVYVEEYTISLLDFEKTDELIQNDLLVIASEINGLKKEINKINK